MKPRNAHEWARVIRAAFPSHTVNVSRSTWHSVRKSGRVITSVGPIRRGYSITVYSPRGNVVFAVNTADYMTRLSRDVPRWLESYKTETA